MGYQLKNKLTIAIYVEVNGQRLEVPLTSQTTLTEMYLVESTRQSVPTLYLQLEDGDRFFSQCPLLDGQRIYVVVQPYNQQAVQYSFRVYSYSSQFNGLTNTYRIDGYLDCPKFWFGTSCGSYNGSTSSVINQVASQCGIFAECDTTHDSQLWMQNNRTFNDFVRYLTAYGYVNDNSYMVRSLNLNNTLVYRNVNAIVNHACEVVAYSQKEGAVLATDIRVKSNSGLNNAVGGYSSIMQGEQAYKNLTVDQTERNLALNADINSQIGRGKIGHSYVSFNQYSDYWKAAYQNLRYSKLYSVDCAFLTSQVTPLNPLKAFRLAVPESQGELDVSDSGLYIVDTRTICVRGVTYAERINGTRKGVN